MIQPQVEQLYLFQRTAPWVIPKFDRRVTDTEKKLFRRFPATQQALRSALYHLFELTQLAQRRPRVMDRIGRVVELHLKRRVKDPPRRRVLRPTFTFAR